MRNFFALVLIALLTKGMLFSQPSGKLSVLQNRFDEQVNALFSLGNGSYMLYGHTRSGSIGGYDIFQRKVNSSFEVIEETFFGTTDDDLLMHVYDAGSYGHVLAIKRREVINNNERWYIDIDAINPDGKRVFHVEMSALASDSVSKITGDPDKGFYLVGNKQDWGDRDQNIWLAYIDKKGRLKWQKTFGERFTDELSTDIVEVAEGYVITGNQVRKKESQPLLIHVDKSGNTLWEQEHSFEKPTSYQSIYSTPEHTFVIFATSPNDMDRDILLIETDLNGRILQQQSVGYVLNKMPLLTMQKDHSYLILSNYGNLPRIIIANLENQKQPKIAIVAFKENIVARDFYKEGEHIFLTATVDRPNGNNVALTEFIPEYIDSQVSQPKELIAERTTNQNRVKQDDNSNNTPGYTVSDRKEISSQNAELDGNYIALIIGVNDYLDESLNDLDNPIKDGARLKNVLLDKYAFAEEDILFLKNPDREKIIETLDELANTIISR